MGVSKRDTDQSRSERKAKKRKLEDAIPDLPGDDSAPIAEEPIEKSSKKRKRSEVAGENEEVEKKSKIAPVTGEVSEIAEESNGVEGPRKSKKERKAERKAKEAAEKAANGVPAPGEVEKTVVEGDEEAKPVDEEVKKARRNNRNREKKRKAAAEGVAKAPRFIVFIGNLPFSTTTASLQKHFASVKPISIRHLTQKDDPKKSKGTAFLEFEGYDHMKTCLKLFHHSMFDDGISSARKINVELSAGGGGNSKERKTKIKGKNQKLNEERSNRIHEEHKKKAEKGMKGLDKQDGVIDEKAIHPSRRGLVPGA